MSGLDTAHSDNFVAQSYSLVKKKKHGRDVSAGNQLCIRRGFAYLSTDCFFICVPQFPLYTADKTRPHSGAQFLTSTIAYGLNFSLIDLMVCRQFKWELEAFNGDVIVGEVPTFNTMGVFSVV